MFQTQNEQEIGSWWGMWKCQGTNQTLTRLDSWHTTLHATHPHNSWYWLYVPCFLYEFMYRHILTFTKTVYDVHS